MGSFRMAGRPEFDLLPRLLSGRQGRKRVRDDCDLRGEGAKQFTVGLDINFGVRRIIRLRQVLAD
jgi:hypothetical protein